MSTIELAFPNPDGTKTVLYSAHPKQVEFHSITAANGLFIGRRGTGKSLALRMEAHIRALSTPGFRYAIVRNSYPDLLKSHLNFIKAEMDLIDRSEGGKGLNHFHATNKQAIYSNGSIGFFTHVDKNSELGNALSAEFYWLGIDEGSEIEWEAQRLIAASVRVLKGSGLVGMTRVTANPIGISAEMLKKYFIDKEVSFEEDKDYLPADWEAVVTTKLSDNPSLDESYDKQFSGMPPHIQKAWREGIFVVEGAYFILEKDHFTDEPVSLSAHVLPNGMVEPAPFIYRALDWGFAPDPAVCLWLAVYGGGRVTVIQERSWTHTTAKDVAAAIKADSEGMRVVATYCDPSMYSGSEATDNSVGDIFDRAGVPLTKAKNDRTVAGFSISEWLGTRNADGTQKLQIYSPGCPMLTKTLPNMRVDPRHAGRLADGKDHWVISLGYFCMSNVPAPIMKPKAERERLYDASTRRVLGSESVRRR